MKMFIYIPLKFVLNWLIFYQYTYNVAMNSRQAINDTRCFLVVSLFVS